jgi:hypothetical protein
MTVETHVTIEKTSKDLKTCLLGCGALGLGGLVLMFAGSPFGGLLIVLGLGGWVVTKLCIWWNHG